LIRKGRKKQQEAYKNKDNVIKEKLSTKTVESYESVNEKKEESRIQTQQQPSAPEMLKKEILTGQRQKKDL